jgi:hypothetical protein
VRRLLVGIGLALGLAALAWAEQETRSFAIRHHAVHDAAALVEPLLSPQGSITLKPKQGSLAVTDSGEILSRVAAALLRWDVAPNHYRVRVNVLMAYTNPTETAALSGAVDGKVWAEINKLFPYYKSFEELDTVEVKAADGSTMEATAGRRYLLRFTLRGMPEDRTRVVLQPLEIVRVGLPGGLPTPTLEKCTVNLPFGQTQVLFVSAGGESTRALMLVLLAEEEARP